MGVHIVYNVTSVGSYTFTVDSATNRLTSRTTNQGTESFTYDASGNMTTMGTFDAENRLILTSQGASYLYDGNGRRFRTNDGNVVNYVYSYTGQLLTEDRITESASNNYIYFNGQVAAIHQQDDNFRLLFKDHLGSTRSVVTVPLSTNGWQYYWNLTESYGYEPFGASGSSGLTRQMFQGKERNGGLDYYGARYYDSRGMAYGSMRWISADSVTSRIYDPPSLNKYTYVRNDPVNLIDPDGRLVAPSNPSWPDFDPSNDPWDPDFWPPGIYFSLNEGGGGVYIPIPHESECDADGYRDATPEESANILAQAETYTGTPYKPKGTDRNGMDCTGLLLRVLSDLGYYSGGLEMFAKDVPSLNILRQLDTGETLNAGDILSWQDHVGFWDPNPGPVPENLKDNDKYKLKYSDENVLSARTSVGVYWGRPAWFDDTWNSATGTGSHTTRLRVRVPCKQ